MSCIISGIIQFLYYFLGSIWETQEKQRRIFYSKAGIIAAVKCIYATNIAIPATAKATKEKN